MSYVSSESRPWPNDIEEEPSERSAMDQKILMMKNRYQHDAQLMQAIASKRDSKALIHIVGHYGPRLKTWLMQRGETSQNADDIVQDVSIKIWNKAHMFDAERGSVAAWIYRLARNHQIDLSRKNNRQVAVDPSILSQKIEEGQNENMSASGTLSKKQAAKAVRDEMKKLPVEQQKILKMAFFEGLSHSQIAQRTGLPLGTVKGRIRSPLKAMKSKLETFGRELNE